MPNKTLLEQVLENDNVSLPLAEKLGEQAEDQGDDDASTSSDND